MANMQPVSGMAAQSTEQAGQFVAQRLFDLSFEHHGRKRQREVQQDRLGLDLRFALDVESKGFEAILEMVFVGPLFFEIADFVLIMLFELGQECFEALGRLLWPKGLGTESDKAGIGDSPRGIVMKSVCPGPGISES